MSPKSNFEEAKKQTALNQKLLAAVGGLGGVDIGV